MIEPFEVTRDNLILWADEYVKEQRRTGSWVLEKEIAGPISTAIKRQGHVLYEQFLKLCYWKTPRTQRWCERNEPDYVEKVTKVALNSVDERLRIEILTLLTGVRLPTASVILHFGHSEPYPILDFRALETINSFAPNEGFVIPTEYSFDFWQRYVRKCRSIAEQFQVDMRTLDRALWQYSASEGKSAEMR